LPGSGVPPAVVHRAEIVYSQGKLEITADNSSLNQILRDIARQTGMKISGGVADDRVFGKYGPAAPAEVLANLLEGTGSNMLLRETAAKVPAELILTPREGGATPPNPNAPGFDDDTPARDQEPPSQAGQQHVQGPPPLPRGAPGMPAMMPPIPPTNATTSAAPTTSGGNPGSPNGVQTPQQIYQQLQQLQQQHPQQ
jgi:hypothetical protein